MSYRSGSEARDYGNEKATTARSSNKTTSVNRSLRDALSPSPDASPRSPSPKRQRNRDRSRSPYRADRAPHGGQKRRAQDDNREASHRTGQRQFKVHYENDRQPYDDGRNGHGSYGGRGTGNGRDQYGNDDRDNYNDNKRRRTRSRSPQRSRPGTSGSGPAQSRQHGVRFEREQEPSGWSVPAGQSNVRDERHDGQSEHNQSTVRSILKPSSDNVGPVNETSSGTQNQTLAEEPEAEQAPPKDESVSIEERRKRREAIKAKYKSQATPLLVQALQQESAPASPLSQLGISDQRSERSVSPSISAPGTPLTDSAAGSPPAITVQDDSELANTTETAPVDGDEPSAADYDAAADMAEERARHDKRMHGQDLPAGAYDETKQHDQQVLLPESIVEAVPQVVAAKPVDDMFASDGEDDMFAPAPAKSTAISEPSLAVNIPIAKELDQSLLDDWDDHEGYYRIILGELLEGRYHVQANLGKGMFSSVVRAMDSTTGELVAIKVIRNNETMIKAATKEMDILEKLADADPEDKKHLIRLKRSFTHKGHMCMVFEHMSINLREVLKKFGRDVGINLKAVRSYAQQMLLGLSLLRKCNILHADLKPDNILVNEARNMLKICDLGSAADASENEITPYLVSRFYRAPEIILGIPYDFAIDMWSIGCTLFELYTGKILFTGRSNNQMLRSIMECRGKFSLKMLKKAEFGAVHFDDVNLNFRSVERDKVTGRDMTKLMNFVKPTRDLKSRLLAAAGATGPGKKPIPEAELKEVNLFADLLEKCLNLNPEKRMTPAEALQHPFIHRVAVPVPRQT